MGFGIGSYATVWEVDKQEGYVRIKISTRTRSRENHDKWETDFRRWVFLVGEAKKKADSLAPETRIKLGSTDYRYRWDKEEKKAVDSCTLFDFEIVESINKDNTKNESVSKKQEETVDASKINDDELPF